MNVVLHKDWYPGLGTQLCAFSTFLDFQVTNLFFHVDSSAKETFKELKDIFGISNDILNIQIYDDHTAIDNVVSPRDHFKIFSPYYKIKKPQGPKPFIGLCCYNSDLPYPVVEDYYDFPDVKFYTVDQYSKIFKFIKESRYDVISLDSRDLNVKEKSKIILEKCDAVIGYEGGIAHLCHMLETPYIMLPWKNDTEMAPSLHLDTRTYFLNDINEILNWSSLDLRVCIRNLQLERTNNKYINGYPISTLLQKEATLLEDEKQFLSQKYSINE